MHFAEKLRKLRIEKGLNQLELAKKMGISNIPISKWEAGKGHPSLAAFSKLVQALGISADYFLFDNVPPEGVAAIDDFDLYEHFRKTEVLTKEEKQTVKNVVDALVFKHKVKEIPEAELTKSEEPEARALRKIASKR